MHGLVRDRLEKILQAKDRVIGLAEVDEHLSKCAECARELEEYRAQSSLLSVLRVEAEPSAGFYARVRQQIEYRAQNSIWSVFVYSPFGKVVAYASLAIALLLGTYVVSSESQDGHLTGNVARIEQNAQSDAPVRGGETDRRDTVLVNFANYQPQVD
jgi:anti-sigma factor RsiW